MHSPEKTEPTHTEMAYDLVLTCFWTTRNENMGGDYHIRKITTRPAELGFHSVNRERNYFLLAHKKLARFIGEPAQIYRQMADRLVNFDVTISSLFWESDPLELRKEILDSLTAGRVGSLEDISTIDWTQNLTPWERENLDVYTQMYLEKHVDVSQWSRTTFSPYPVLWFVFVAVVFFCFWFSP